MTTWTKPQTIDARKGVVKAVGGQFMLNGYRFRFAGGNQYSWIVEMASKLGIGQLLDLAALNNINVFRTWCFDAGKPGEGFPTNANGNFRFLQYPIGTNLISNPSFETNTAGYALDADFTRSNADAQDGSYSIHQVSASGYEGMHCTLPVTAHTDYVWTFWYKLTYTGDGDPGHLPPTVRIEDQSNADWIDNGLLGNTTVWKQRQVKFNSGTNTQVRLSIYNFGGNNNAFYDNWSLCVAATPSLAPFEATFQQLDMVLDEARKRGIRLILSLADNPTYGTKQTYCHWADAIYGTSLEAAGYPYVGFFDNANCRTLYKAFFNMLANRVNTINGRVYKNDDTIFSWELGNELRYDVFSSEGGTQNTASSQDIAAVINWINDVTTYMKSVDPNHMIGYGDCAHTWQWANGDTVSNGSGYGVDYNMFAALSGLDYLDAHLYPAQGNSGDINGFGQRLLGIGPGPSGPGLTAQIKDWVAAAKNNNKPVILGELGEEKDTIRSNTHYPMYPRSAMVQQIFADFYDNDGDGICWWSVSNGANAGFELDLDPWDGNTTNLNYNDDPVKALFKARGETYAIPDTTFKGWTHASS